MRLKINWNYQLKSMDNSWNNTISKRPDFNIFIDNNKGLDFNNNNNVAILYEPKSILPDFYKYVIENKNRFYKIFTHREEYCDNKKVIQMNPFFPSWIKEEDSRIYEKTKLVSMIASDKIMCDGHKYRQDVARDFPYKDDLYGRGRNYIDKKITGLKDYMFSVAMENEISDVYYTEKILDCFLTGTIPIYWGTKKIINFFNPDGIVFLNQIDIRKIDENLYNDKIEAVRENLDIAKKINYTSNHMIDFITKKLKNEE